METTKTLYRYGDDYFDYRLARMRESLNELAAIIERQNTLRPFIEPRIIYRPVVHQAATPGKPRKPKLVFPFTILDRAVERFVKIVVARWIGRITYLLRAKRHG